MGGRGSTSSLARLQKYGTEFKEVKTTAYGGKLHMKDKRILFIESTAKTSKTPYDSMMPNRIYVLINSRDTKRKVKSITFTDKMGFAYKFVDVNVAHHNIGKGKLGHTHMTYNRKEPREMNRRERKLVRKVLAVYHRLKYIKKKGEIKKWLHYMKHFPLGKM